MAQSGDMKAHEATYGGFMRLLKVGTILSRHRVRHLADRSLR